MEKLNIENITRYLKKFRERLTNFSRRNKELYFKTHALSLNLTRNPFAAFLGDKKSGHLFEQFVGLKIDSPILTSLLAEGELDLNSFFCFDSKPTADLFEVFDQQRGKITKSFERIRLADQRFQREFGLSGAWLLGPFLCWRTSRQYGESEIAITPIFKIPIDLSVSKSKVWKLELESHELTINPSLRLYLRNAWGIDLPESVDEDSLPAALKKILKLFCDAGKHIETTSLTEIPRIPPRNRPIFDEDGQITRREPVKLESELRSEEHEVYKKTTSDVFVLVDVFHVSQINASKMALVEDYDRIIENYQGHPIISELILGRPLKTSADAVANPKQLDAYKESFNHFVVEIDSTQHRAVDRSTKDSAIVIQGPPGTGKSQTITNLIAEHVANGKKVLFVSEKRAALDVVFTRLKKAGIDDQCVLLHSSDLNKSDLYQSFLNLVGTQADSTIAREWESVCIELDTTKEEINGFRACLGETHNESELTLSEICSRFAEIGQVEPDLSVRNQIGLIKFVELERLMNGLSDIETIASKISGLKTHPWINRKPEIAATSTLKSELESTNQKLSRLCEKLNIVILKIREIAPAIEITSAPELVTNEVALNEFLNLSDAIQVSAIKLGEYLDAHNNFDSSLAELLSTIVSSRDCYHGLDPQSELHDVSNLWSYFKIDRGILDWFSSEFRRQRNLARSICKDKKRYREKELYKGFVAYMSAFNSSSQLLEDIAYPFKTNPEETEALIAVSKEVEELAKHLRSVSKLRQIVRGGDLKTTWTSFSAIRNFLDSVTELRGLLNSKTEIETEIHQIRANINKLFSIPLEWSQDLESSFKSTMELRSRMEDLDILDSLFAIIEGTKKRTNVQNIKELVLFTLADRVGNDWSGYIYRQIINRWYDEVRSQAPALRQFDSNYFDSQVERFKELELKHRDVSQSVVKNKWAEAWQKEDRNSVGVRLLSKEANKKRKIRTPREMMEDGALKTMLALKPVWLMSPLSISQMLPLERQLFDLIVFDEASQVRVEDAMPSIFRASRMVVVGDRQQMPPTNFFDSGQQVDNDDDDDDEEIPESILDLALQVYPDVLLEWHYRSRNEALIAFSNRAFYGGRLIAPPNPQILTQGKPIEFVELRDAYFNAKDGNRKEAEALVDSLVRLIREAPERSIGVIAMGQSQMKVIDEVIEERMSDPVFRELIDAASNLKDGEADVGFFVKNLENVQGDERDVILISVGYASARQGRKLYKNFGPLSKRGGGRRLNVAITRAKQKILVFCSFNPDEIATDEESFSKNPDSVYFGRYLKYARAVSNNDFAQAQNVLNSFPMGGVITSRKPTRFNLDVKRRLEELGYKISTEIGTCGYFIDLGVHHPVDDRCFVLGVECDGALFHSTQYARDRDKNREDLLRSRGWNVARVWSIDWSKNWKAEIARLDLILKELLSSSDNKAVESQLSSH
jgi:superfamily I DNA and/or RNA helicase/very-short-patch-repair endonuclease